MCLNSEGGTEQRKKKREKIFTTAKKLLNSGVVSYVPTLSNADPIL